MEGMMIILMMLMMMLMQMMMVEKYMIKIKADSALSPLRYFTFT